QYLAQLAGRSDDAFQAAPPIPEAAAQYLRDEPKVQRAVANQSDLATIEAHIAEAEETMARLDAVIAADDTSIIYPGLAARRARIAERHPERITSRTDLAEQQLTRLTSTGELTQATTTRRARAAEYAAVRTTETAQLAEVDTHRATYDKLYEEAGEISSTLDS